MEVAIRAINLIVVKDLFKESTVLDKKFWAKYDYNLYMHGIFIYDNLEYDSLTEDGRSNHFISNLVGLIFLGIYFRNMEKKFYRDNNQKKWLDFGLKYIENEIRSQVNEDGTTYEDSTNYHKLVTELFLITKIICSNNKLSLSNYYDKKLRKMCLFVKDLMMFDNVPLIGDVDSGKILILENYFEWRTDDFSELIRIYNSIYENKIIINDAKKSYIGLLLEGKKGVENNKEKNNRKKVLKEYKEGGYYFINNDNFTLLFKGGKLGFNNKGNHSHNDQLSYCLNVKETSFFIDPGVYSYNESEKKRKYYRATSNHNVLNIDNKEANEFIDGDNWGIIHNTNTIVTSFNDEEIIASHLGYLERFDVIYTRRIKINEKKVIINDILDKTVKENIYSNIILDSDVNISSVEKKGIKLKKGDIEVFIKCENYKIEDVLISKGYGVESISKKIVIESITHKTISYEIILLDIKEK